MSQDGSEETAGITLFSKQTKKRRRKVNGTGDAARQPLPSTNADSQDVEKQELSVTSNAEVAATDGAAERQAPASTSGQENAVTFRSLGISEWLDRYRAFYLLHTYHYHAHCCTHLQLDRSPLGLPASQCSADFSFSMQQFNLPCNPADMEIHDMHDYPLVDRRASMSSVGCIAEAWASRGVYAL